MTITLREETDCWGLVAAAQRGDRDAYGQIYLDYRDEVHRIIRSHIGNSALAEDLTAETFLRALRRISSVNDQGRDLGAWLRTIAKNLVLDHVKSSRYKLERPIGNILDSDETQLSPEQIVVQRATSEWLWALVGRLGKDQRECLELRFRRGLSVAQAAAAMNRKDEALKALQHRALIKLRQQIAWENRS